MTTENSRTLNPALYPELGANGNLSQALQRVFDELSVDLSVTKGEIVVNPWWAFVSKGSRHSQVSTALYEHKFNVDLWFQGVQYGSGWTSDLTEVTRAIIAFHLGTASSNELASRFVWFHVNKQAATHERGADYFVAESWRDLEDWLASKKPLLMEQLLPLVVEAAKRPELRQLLPFTSHSRLCFSRTTGYPYSYDCPLAWPIEDGRRFRVTAADEKTILGEGDAARAADILAANLPRNCGPAIHGTAEDLNRPSRI